MYFVLKTETAQEAAQNNCEKCMFGMVLLTRGLHSGNSCSFQVG